jgi:hypothetical protein
MGAPPPRKTKLETAAQQRDAWDRAGERLRLEDEQAAALRKHADRRSSMRTLFEFRGRRWVIQPLLVLALGGAGYAVARLFLH